MGVATVEGRDGLLCYGEPLLFVDWDCSGSVDLWRRGEARRCCRRPPIVQGLKEWNRQLGEGGGAAFTVWLKKEINDAVGVDPDHHRRPRRG